MAVAVTTVTVHAQTTLYQSQSKDYALKMDTLVNADTTVIYFNEIGSHLKNIDVLVKKVSGTIAGKVYIQGSNTGWVNYHNLDSLSCTDVAENKKPSLFTATSFLSYRVFYITSGTQVCVVYAAYLRRPDE